MADTGNGATLTFSGFTADIVEMTPGAYKRAVVDTTHLGTTGSMTSCPGDLYSVDEITIKFNWDSGDTLPDITAAAQTTTVTWPLGSGESTAANLTGTGYMTELGFPTFVNDTLQQAELKIQYDGATGPTYTAGS